MQVKKVDFRKTGYFSDIVLDYLTGSEKLKGFYQLTPEIKSFKEAIKKKDFPQKHREILVGSLQNQYSRSNINKKQSEAVFRNIELLKKENTFTITTGHQLCLFTGPLYFIYKIVSIINLCKKLKEAYPENNFVPVYWMATEDHDFDEIDHFRFKGQKIQWKTDQTGAVGRMNTQGLEEVFQGFSELIGDYNTRGEKLKKLFSDAYLKHANHADAFRHLVNALFAHEGLVIVDGDERKLKELFAPVVKEELTNNVSFKLVEATNKKLSEHYKIQVNPREINLFYLKDGIRERMIKQDTSYLVNNTNLQFSEEEILNLLKKEPEIFSPNVLLRPLYQESILPNLAYIGGGGELAYWFQLKSTFGHFEIPMPILLLRNSAKWVIGKTVKWMQELGADVPQLFKAEGDWIKEDTQAQSDDDLQLSKVKEEVQSIFHSLSERSAKMDPTLKVYVEASLQKAQNRLEKLSKKMIRVQKRKNSERVGKIIQLKEALFPNKGLQERTDNFSTIFLALGEGMMEELFAAFELPEEEFVVFIEKQ